MREKRYEMDDQVMNAKDVAAYLKVHRSTIYRLMKRHQLPAFQIRGEWRFNREHIDEWRDICCPQLSHPTERESSVSFLHTDRSIGLPSLLAML
jgi:excisionase family DNA binding protein